MSRQVDQADFRVRADWHRIYGRGHYDDCGVLVRLAFRVCRLGLFYWAFLTLEENGTDHG